jgi:dTDP-4-amino-4,6-dideoxygalactose transaminase
MEVKNYPIFKVHVDVDGALENLKTVLTSGFLNEGECVTQFTDFLNNYLNHKNVVLLNSCTSALTLALKLAGVSPND